MKSSKIIAINHVKANLVKNELFLNFFLVIFHFFCKNSIIHGYFKKNKIKKIQKKSKNFKKKTWIFIGNMVKIKNKPLTEVTKFFKKVLNLGFFWKNGNLRPHFEKNDDNFFFTLFYLNNKITKKKWFSIINELNWLSFIFQRLFFF